MNIDKQTWPSVLEKELDLARQEAINSPTYSITHKGKISGIYFESTQEVAAKPFTEKELQQMENESKVRTMLNEKNLKVEAILPTDLFRKILEPHQFFTFKNIDENGSVPFDVKSTATLISNRSLTNYIAWVPVIIGTLFFLYGGFIISENIIGAIFSSLIIGFIGFIIMVWLTLTLFRHIEPFFWKRVILKNKAAMKKAMWPQKNDSDGINQLKNLTEEEVKALDGLEKLMVDRVKIIFPEAPKEIMQRLFDYKRAGYTMYTVAHEKAFDYHFTDAQIKAFSEIWDPIIGIDFPENVTVIVGQYGEFDEEKELIASIKAQFNNFKEEYFTNSNN